MELHKDYFASKMTEDIDRLLVKEELLIRSDFKKKTSTLKEAQWSFYLGIIFYAIGTMCVVAGVLYYLSLYISFWKASFIMALISLSCGGLIYGGAKEKEIKAKQVPLRSLKNLGDVKRTFHEKMNEITQH